MSQVCRNNINDKLCQYKCVTYLPVAYHGVKLSGGNMKIKHKILFNTDKTIKFMYMFIHFYRYMTYLQEI